MSTAKSLNEIAELNHKNAERILEDTGIIRLWGNIGATIRPVGSFKSGLMIRNLDIDLHIYTDEVKLSEDFTVMQKFAENPGVKRFEYINQLNTDEECIEWHVHYHDNKEDAMWKLDIIHLRKGSTFDGFVERVTDRVIELLTPETRETILQIKHTLPADIPVKSIEIYQAVLADGVQTTNEFMEWRALHPFTGVADWLG